MVEFKSFIEDIMYIFTCCLEEHFAEMSVKLKEFDNYEIKEIIQKDI